MRLAIKKTNIDFNNIKPGDVLETEEGLYLLCKDEDGEDYRVLDLWNNIVSMYFSDIEDFFKFNICGRIIAIHKGDRLELSYISE